MTPKKQEKLLMEINIFNKLTNIYLMYVFYVHYLYYDNLKNCYINLR
jgi:hypothetical protein